jgi:hypothetical protein
MAIAVTRIPRLELVKPELAESQKAPPFKLRNTPTDAVPAYKTFGFLGSMTITLTDGSNRPALEKIHVPPPSADLYIPPEVAAYTVDETVGWIAML